VGSAAATAAHPSIKPRPPRLHATGEAQQSFFVCVCQQRKACNDSQKEANFDGAPTVKVESFILIQFAAETHL
jgi:hypothetical protein